MLEMMFFVFFVEGMDKEMDKVELDVDKAKSMHILISRLWLGLHVYNLHPVLGFYVDTGF